MSILTNKLKLEVKSINDTQMARFTSTSKNADIYVVPEDSSNFYTVIGTSVHSNAETYISLNSEQNQHKIVSFYDTNINVGTDTLFKGNLVIMGSITTLGYDVLTTENKFILNNYGTSAEKGLNSVSEKSLEYLNTEMSRTSNNLCNRMLHELDNLSVVLGISNLTTLQNNIYTQDDFNVRFSEKTLDNLLQGTSNKFITNHEYSTSNPVIITGTIIASNIYTNTIYVTGNLYAQHLYGDGSQITNINPDFFTTNNVKEIPESSNLYFTSERAGLIIYSSNQHLSNYVTHIDHHYRNRIITENINGSNYVLQLMNNTNNYYVNESNALQTFYSLSQLIILNNINLYTTQLNDYYTNISNNALNYLTTENANASNAILNISNQTIDSTNAYLQNINNHLLQTSNNLFRNLNESFVHHLDVITNTSNLLHLYLDSLLEDTSNYVLFQENILKASLQSSNISFENKLINTSNMVYNALHTSNININEYLRINSNQISLYSQSLFEQINLNIIGFSNEFSQIISSSSSSELNKYTQDLVGLSNLIALNETEKQNNIISENNVIITQLTNINNYANNIDDKNIPIMNSSNTITSNYLIYTSNLLAYNAIFDNATQLNTINNSINNTSNVLNTRINNLTTNNIPQTASNLYFTNALFNISLNTKSVDNIPIIPISSNKVIVNNTYAGNLNIQGDLLVSNIVVYGNISIFNTSVYNTERLEIVNSSNSQTLEINHYGSNDIIQLNSSIGRSFTLNSNGNLAINKLVASEVIDVNGSIGSTFLRGSGEQITNINLSDRTTDHLSESLNSNLYFTTFRTGLVMAERAEQTSNLINNLSNMLLSDLLIHDYHNSNYVYNISNSVIDDIHKTKIQNYDYILSSCNNIISFAGLSSLNQSNHINNVSNVLDQHLNVLYLNHSNLLSDDHLVLTNRINYSNLQTSNYVLNISNITNDAISTFNMNQTNYLLYTSNLISSRLNTINTNHLNMVFNVSNQILDTILYKNASNYIRTTSNNINSYINSINSSQSNAIQSVYTNIINFTNNSINNIAIPVVAGDTFVYNYNYDPNLIHLNFKDIKILNSISTNDYRIIDNSSNLVDIYPVINNFTIYNNNNYTAINSYVFISTSNVYITMNDQYEIKKLLNGVNNKTFSVHFLFNTISVQNTPIYYIGSSSRLFFNIKISYGIMFIIVGNGKNNSILRFYLENPILPSIWYTIDIVCEVNANVIGVEVYLNALKQKVYLQNVTTPFSSGITMDPVIFNKYLQYKFASSDPNVLVADSSGNGRILTNNGGFYAWTSGRNSIQLETGTDAMLPNTNWGTFTDLTISMWFKNINLVDGDKILTFTQNMTTSAITHNNGQLFFIINDTIVYQTPYIIGSWNHIIWNVISSSNSQGFIRINDKSRYYYNEISLINGSYMNKLGSTNNQGSFNITDFIILNIPLTLSIENELYTTWLSLNSSLYLRYLFESSALLTNDSSVNGRTLTNTGGIYALNFGKKSILLENNDQASFENTAWQTFNDFSISGWFKTVGFANGNKLLDLYYSYMDEPAFVNDTTNLIAWYKFENNFNDSSPYSRNLTSTSYPTLDGTIKRIGSYAANFSSQNNFLNNSTITVSNATFTISFWVRLSGLTSTTPYYWIATQGSSGGIRGYLHIGVGSRLYLNFWGDDLQSTTLYNLDAINNTWVHCVFIYDKQNNRQMRIYKDTVLIGSKNASGDTSFASGTFNIGKGTITTGFTGQLDDFRIYNRVLTQDEINKLYAYAEVRYKGIAILNDNNKLSFQINNAPVYELTSYIPNTWYHIIWNITNSTSQTFVKINEMKNYYNQVSIVPNNYKYPKYLATGENYTYPDGTTVRISGSTTFSVDSSTSFYQSFNFNTIDFGWISANRYTSGTANTTYRTGYAGEYIQIDLGEAIVLNYYKIYTKTGWENRSPKDFRVYASNDSNAWTNVNHSTWHQIDEVINAASYSIGTFYIENIRYAYRYFLLIANKTFGNDNLMITELELYGTPMYINRIGVTSNVGSLYVSDFKVLTVPLTPQFENEMYTSGMTVGSYSNNFEYNYNSNAVMYLGSYDSYNVIEYDYKEYTRGAVFTNTYFSSNSWINPAQLIPIVRSSAYDYQTFSNLIYSSYFASNYVYQYSYHISSNNVVNNEYYDIADSRLTFADRTVANVNFVLTEIEANIKLKTGYYYFMLDLQNDVTADLLIGRQNDTSIDDYIRVATYYNSNLLNSPSSTISNSSNLVLRYPVYIVDGYYRFYQRMLRTMNNRNNKYFIAKYYYINSWNGLSYNLNDSNILLNYIQYLSLDSAYQTGAISANNDLYINHNTITATSNIYSYNTINISNYNYDIYHVPTSTFFAGNSSNNLKLQDFRIYSMNDVPAIVENISNVLYYGQFNQNISYTSNVTIKPVRWLESSAYSSNFYYNDNRHIIYNGTGDIGISLGKNTRPSTTLDIYTDDPTIYSIKTNNTIWVQSGVVASSDMRIKTNIRDIDDQDALNKLLLLEPKTYNYIDKNRGSSEVIGFSAQQVSKVIPNAVKIETEVIPNIYSHALLQNNHIYLTDTDNDILKNLSLDSIIVFEYDNTKYYEYVVEILNISVIKIENKSRLDNVTVFVYGKVIHDFHTLDKNTIYTLSICAIQDIYRLQQTLNQKISSLYNNLELSIISTTHLTDIQNISSRTEQAHNNVASFKIQYNEIQSSNLFIETKLKQLRNEYCNYDINFLLQTSNMILELNQDIDKLSSAVVQYTNQNDVIIENINILNQSVNTLENNILNINNILLKHNLR
jgi:hypothetical protein